MNPSVNTLWSLANALETPMGSLFSVNEKKGTFLNSIKAQFVSDGVRCFSLYPAVRTDFEFTYIEYKPGSSTGKQLGRHGGIECLLVLDGTTELTLGDKEYILNKEQSIQFWGNIPHGVKKHWGQEGYGNLCHFSGENPDNLNEIHVQDGLETQLFVSRKTRVMSLW